MTLERPSLHGANCADLHPIALERYFHCDASRDKFAAKVGKAICDNCVVQQACLRQAMLAPTPDRGIVAGKTAWEIGRAKKWQKYEAGETDQAPSEGRPAWLERYDNVVELPARQTLTPEQREHWEQTMINARRAYAYAKHQLELDDELQAASSTDSTSSAK